ncbi:hypothetical protein BD560DRAFT_400665 [Blakeslea trispora]|nr:hypothetical protein BD560DRAFT_400665 [Blakeslea trispora]
MDLLQRQQTVADPMYLKACEMACKLLDASENMNTAVNELQRALDNPALEDNSVYAPLRKTIDQYEHLIMINNVLKAIYPSVQSLRHQQYLESATVSATNTSNHQLSKVYQLVSSSRLNNDDRVQQELIYISRQIQSIVEQEFIKPEITDYAFAQPIEASRSTASPVQRNTPPTQRNTPPVTSPAQRLQNLPLFPSLQIQQPMSVSSQVQHMPPVSTLSQSVSQPMTVNSDPMQPSTGQHSMPATIPVTPTAVITTATAMPSSPDQSSTSSVPLVAQPISPAQQALDTPKTAQQINEVPPQSSSQPSESFLASQFLEKFELTATQFAELNKISVNSVWESLIIHALPQSQGQWAKENLLGKDYTWEKAKQIFRGHFLKTSHHSSPVILKQIKLEAASQPPQKLASPSIQPAQPPQQRPISPQTQLGQQQQHGASEVGNDSSQIRTSQKRIADYAEHLFGLEMRLYENIDDYNKRYMRYCNIAKMDLSDASLMQRYARSLLKVHRNLIHSNISGKTIPSLPQLMDFTSAIIRDYEHKTNPKKIVTPYSCPQNHPTLSSIRFLNQKNPTNVERHPDFSSTRKRPMSFSEANTASKRPTIF